jgi:hypothetical protein
VIAEFRIKNPVVKVRQNLTLIVAYKNTAATPVTFRYGDTDLEARIYRRGQSKPLIGGQVGEFPYSEATLQPGESITFEEVFHLGGWDLEPGHYEVQFFYHLGLLRDESLADKYIKKYPNYYYLVPWEDRKHPFTVTK